MKVINPIGRPKANDGIQPRACMCDIVPGEFQQTRGSGDGCFQCNCSCGMRYDNRFVAQFTIRES